ncbi:hypothetical protein EDD16DRAFT_1525556 [Pisolithus croceorrhizus]|nr:hypothetical protein EDD16DRAFT_1525556 [Pisolithus croceorrhizus]KAI6162618.1 hypothetical protein EDD17DRAFT_1507784 [Pisolithus thermaeus]
MVFLPHLDPEDQDDEIAIKQHILAVTRKSQEDGCDGEDAREEKACPTKAGDYKKAFTPFTATQRIFKDEMDAYDRERRDTKDPKTIGQRNRIIQQWWESVSDKRKAEAGRAVEKWNKLGAPKGTHDSKTTGSHAVMFIAHEAGEGQIKMAVFETAPGDGKKAFTESSEASKDWVLNGENILMDYLLTAPVEENSAEKQEVEISLDEDGNPQMPTWAGQKLKFMKKPKAKVPQGLLIKSCMEYLDSQSIPEGFMMKDPSKWTKADLGMPWVAKRRMHLYHGSLTGDLWGRAVKKREWMDPEDDSEEEVGGAGMQHSDAGPSRKMTDTGEVVNKGVGVAMDVGDEAPEDSSPAWHASKDHIAFLRSLSIMPRYQVLVDLVVGLPEEVRMWKGEAALPHWATWTWGAKCFPQEIHLDRGSFWKALGQLQSTRFASSSSGWEVVLGLGLLLRECSHAQEVEEDGPLVSDLQSLLNSELGIRRAEDVMDIVGLIVSRLEQSSAGMKEPKKGGEGAVMGGGDREDEEKEEEEVPAVVPTQKRKRAESGIVTRGKKVAKQDGKKGKKDGEKGKKDGENRMKGVRTWNQTKKAMGL